MEKELIFTRVEQLTGNLKPAGRASAADLKDLERTLAESFADDPTFQVFGDRLHHAGAHQMEAASRPAERYSHLEELLERRVVSEEATAPPLVFRRETEFHNNLLGQSVPVWGSGMAPTRSLGPFVDDLGLQVWFDVYQPTKMVHVFRKGASAPSLLIPIWGTVSEKKSYKIEPGSVWIASDLIAADPGLKDHYTGLKVTGGSLDLSEKAEVTDGKIIIKLGANATLQLNLNQNKTGPASSSAGFDANKAKVKLPETLTLKFSTGAGQLVAGDASCKVFGCGAEFTFSASSPVWLGPLGQILIPYSVKTTSRQPDTFEVFSSDSKLCRYKGKAKLKTGCGWLLPAAKVSPSQLGAAAGTGALAIAVLKGITADWKGLKGALTKLVQPGIIVEPGMVTVLDFFASNLSGKQRWRLWKNAPAQHHSEMTLSFGKAFPFIYISVSKGSESVLFFCKHKGSLDRPVDANGAPFKIESSIALASITQTGSSFRAFLFDNDLLFDGNFNKPEAFKPHSITLRNALFSVTRPFSLFLMGDLVDDRIEKGVVALLHAVYLYLPTLPDPYVASYTALLRGASQRQFGQLQIALAGFVKWPDPSVAEDDDAFGSPYVYFRFAPLDLSLLFNSASAINAASQPNQPIATTSNNFQAGVRTFNRNLVSRDALERVSLPTPLLETGTQVERDTARAGAKFSKPIESLTQTDDARLLLRDLDTNPMFGHLADKTIQVDRVLRVANENTARTGERSFAAAVSTERSGRSANVMVPPDRDEGGRDILPDMFRLLDVSSRADQMGVSLGTALRVRNDERGNANVSGSTSSLLLVSGMPLQILNMDVVGVAQNLRALTLPQISWEPISNIPLPVEGPFNINDWLDNLITITPGLVVYDDDGPPTRFFSESPYLVPVTPLSVTKHFIKEYNDEQTARQLHSIFTLPFALIAQASFERDAGNPANDTARLSFNRPHFDELHGGLQIKSVALKSKALGERPSFSGRTLQIDNNIKWVIFGIPLTGSTLGKTVKTIFNNIMSNDKPKVPLEKIEFSGYGASMFSDWFNHKATIADVSQAKFDVLVGRTAHEVVQVRSVMYTEAGCVHVVRTITLMRSPNGYVFRSDSGWKAESDATFDCNYKIVFGQTEVDVNNTYEFHKGAVKGITDIREIKDYPAAGDFESSFSLNESGLPVKLTIPSLVEWKKVFGSLGSLDEQLKVELQAVVFDGDVHLDNVTSGGVKDTVAGDFKVQSRKMLGYVQLKPSSILIPPKVLTELLNFQEGSLGGPVDCIIDVANSKQKMRLARVDLSPALDNANNHIFTAAVRGSLILPQDGSWSVVTQQVDTKDVKLIEEGKTVPLIRREGDSIFRIADPRDVVKPDSNSNFGVVQSTGTQKLLFDIPQFAPNEKKLKSSQTYFADAYKLLNSKGIFPNVANALPLTNAEKEIEILGEGLMKMTERTLILKTLQPSNFSYPFIDEPGILKIYAEYETNGGDGKLKLGIDSAAALADKWKAALSNIRVVVDLGPFQRLMWVDGNFNASSGASPKYDKPNLQFGSMLETVVNILRILKQLSGDDFDNGMNVGMSNSPDSWEYKFECSQDIPVIKFPSPLLLSTNPNPPLKLEAGLKVGFYFNALIAIPTDLKQLVPACGAYVDFYGRIQVMCFTLAAASVYAVGQANLGIAADSKAGLSLRMKFGFGVEIVVGLPVVGNASVLYMILIEVGISSASVTVGAFMLFRGHAEICGGLVGVTIQIEAGGSVTHTPSETNCVAQVTFSIDITILWVIDISFSDTWSESRQIG
jgi:hypothetical protein